MNLSLFFNNFQLFFSLYMKMVEFRPAYFVVIKAIYKSILTAKQVQSCIGMQAVLPELDAIWIGFSETIYKMVISIEFRRNTENFLQLMYWSLECLHAMFFSTALQTTQLRKSVYTEIPLIPVTCQMKAQYNEGTDLQTEVSPLQNPFKFKTIFTWFITSQSLQQLMVLTALPVVF